MVPATKLGASELKTPWTASEAKPAAVAAQKTGRASAGTVIRRGPGGRR
jgi:hypothetical protein